MKSFIIISLLILVMLTGCAGSVDETSEATVIATDQTVTEGKGESDATATIPPSVTSPASPTPEPTETVTSEPETPAAWIAYIATDGNLWLVDRVTGNREQLTQDAEPLKPESDQQSVTYCCPRWSSDGVLLAYQQEVTTPADQGYQQSLWVYDMEAGQPRPLLENQQVHGFDWQPGTHLLAYGLPIATEYFLTSPGEPNEEFANGIWAIDVEGGEPYELVPPQRGYGLVAPNWSPDARFLGFDEVMYMEGRGQFAYYDFMSQQYFAWDEVIGWYSWSSDGEQIAYDRMAYVPTSEERIWLNSRQGDTERALSPDYELGYAFWPLFAPKGENLAYLAELSGTENQLYHLFVMEVPDGEPQDLGIFERVQWLSWSPDGTYLIFSAGPYEQQQVVEVMVADAVYNFLLQGSQPAWQPIAP